MKYLYLIASAITLSGCLYNFYIGHEEKGLLYNIISLLFLLLYLSDNNKPPTSFNINVDENTTIKWVKDKDRQSETK